MKNGSSQISLVVLVFVSGLGLSFMSGCSSKSTQTNSKTATGANAPTAESLPAAPATPGVPLATAVDIEGKAYSLDGAAVTARAIITTGESRRPVYIDGNRVAFASRRASLERWQVFEADFAKKIERRVSFDAGDTEPIVTLGRRLVIASSSDERKSGERVLNKYRGVFAPKETSALSANETSLQHLLLEHPASGRKGTEWVRMSSQSAQNWIVSVDKDLKQGLALQREGSTTEVFRVAMAMHAREPETRGWTSLKIEMPAAPAPAPPAASGAPVIVDGKILPDGKQVVWSNGTILWTTAINGKGANRLGDDSIPAANDLAVDPTGQWIVFSSPTPTRGRNLMALHRSGRCLKTLTEFPGDEIEPTFSPDGTKLLFALREGDGSRIGEIPFANAATLASACP